MNAYQKCSWSGKRGATKDCGCAWGSMLNSQSAGTHTLFLSTHVLLFPYIISCCLWVSALPVPCSPHCSWCMLMLPSDELPRGTPALTLCAGTRAESGRRVVRARKVSQRVGQVSAAERERTRNARLDALEDDDAGGGGQEGAPGDSDEEFVLPDSDDGALPLLLAACMRSRGAPETLIPGTEKPK